MYFSTFVVRRAVAEDSALLASIGARTFRDTFAAENDPDDLERYISDAFAPETLAAELAAPGATFLLAYDEALNRDRPVGYAKLLAGRADDSVRGPTPVELVRLYVEADAIGGGYGAALMQACLDEAARGGFETLWLGVWEQNQRARRFYERWGFTAVGVHDFVIGRDVQTDIVMERPVNQAS